MKKEKKYNEYSNIILTIIVTIALFFSIVSASFTYYLIKMQKYTEKNTPFAVGILTFDRNNLLEYSTTDNEEAKNKLHFSITTSSLFKDKIKYNIYFNVLENNIISENIVYLTNGKKGDNSSDIVIKYGNKLDEYKKQIDSINVSKKDTVGYIPSINDNKILIGCGEIGSSSTDEWDFKVWLNESNYINEGIIRGYISIETEY